MGKWNRAAPVVEPEEGLQLAEVVAERTYEQLATRGWCLWKCDVLGDDIIVVVRDELVQDIPEGYPVYTSQELFDLLDLDDAMVRMIHEAKKLGDASIIGGS